jgi:hypothetical protein
MHKQLRSVRHIRPVIFHVYLCVCVCVNTYPMLVGMYVCDATFDAFAPMCTHDMTDDIRLSELKILCLVLQLLFYFVFIEMFFL